MAQFKKRWWEPKHMLYFEKTLLNSIKVWLLQILSLSLSVSLFLYLSFSSTFFFLSLSLSLCLFFPLSFSFFHFSVYLELSSIFSLHPYISSSLCIFLYFFASLFLTGVETFQNFCVWIIWKCLMAKLNNTLKLLLTIFIKSQYCSLFD